MFPSRLYSPAFSLVELSIVLVILGLLTGGILAGQSLIRASELRAVSTEYARYITATMTFRDKYFALPGDFNKAVSFWGAADGANGESATCFTTVSTTSATCNGDGSGTIEPITTRSMESFRYWQHLANAGLIEGSYTGSMSGGTFSGSTRYAKSGINIPASKLGNAAWYMQKIDPATSSGWVWSGAYGNSLFLGAVEADDIPELSALNPAEAWNIDTKLDDGKPAFGMIRTPRISSGCNSTTVDADAATAAYTLTQTGITCRLLFIPNI